MHVIRLMRQPPEHVVLHHDHLDAASAERLYDSLHSTGSFLGHPLSGVVAARLKNDDARALGNHTIEPVENAGGRIAVDPGIDDSRVEPGGAQHGLKLRGIGLAARDALAIGIARAQCDDRRCVSLLVPIKKVLPKRKE